MGITVPAVAAQNVWFCGFLNLGCIRLVGLLRWGIGLLQSFCVQRTTRKKKMRTHFNARSGFHIHSPSLWEAEVSINLWSCSHLNNIFDIMNFRCSGTSVAEVFWDVMWHLVFQSLSRDCSAFIFRVKQSENNSIGGDCSNQKMKWLQHWAVTRPMTQCYNSENLNIRCVLYCCCCLYRVLYTDILFSPYFISGSHFWFIFKSFLQVTANIDTNSLFYIII